MDGYIMETTNTAAATEPTSLQKAYNTYKKHSKTIFGITWLFGAAAMIGSGMFAGEEMNYYRMAGGAIGGVNGALHWYHGSKSPSWLSWFLFAEGLAYTASGLSTILAETGSASLEVLALPTIGFAGLTKLAGWHKLSTGLLLISALGTGFNALTINYSEVPTELWEAMVPALGSADQIISYLGDFPENISNLFGSVADAYQGLDYGIFTGFVLFCISTVASFTAYEDQNNNTADAKAAEPERATFRI